jgi:hypothetical protein
VIAIASRAGLTHLVFIVAEEVPMAESARPRVVGFNHVAPSVILQSTHEAALDVVDLADLKHRALEQS